MKCNILILFFLIAFSCLGYSQSTKFALIQNANNKPFFVKIPNLPKPLSSSATGYIILPKLQGLQNIKIGFLGSNDEYDFTIDVTNADKGYLLKNTDDKGWALFNWQNLDFVYQNTGNNPVKNLAESKTEEKKEENSALGQRLAKATGDNDIVIKEDKPTPKPKENLPTEIKEPVKTIAPDIKDPSKVITPEIKVEPKKELVIGIETLNEKSNENGYQGNYKIVNEDSTTDLISVTILPTILKGNEEFIPPLIVRDTTKTNSTDSNNILANIPKVENAKTNADVLKPIVPELKPHLEIKTNDINTASQPKYDSVNNISKDSLVMINSDCNAKDLANDADVEDLFAKMAVEKDLDEKLLLAKKTFKKKCFSSKQIKNLTGGFFNDKNKYELLYTAFPYVNDTDNFKKLEAILTETYYINMFRTMVNK